MMQGGQTVGTAPTAHVSMECCGNGYALFRWQESPGPGRVYIARDNNDSIILEDSWLLLADDLTKAYAVAKGTKSGGSGANAWSREYITRWKVIVPNPEGGDDLEYEFNYDSEHVATNYIAPTCESVAILQSEEKFRSRWIENQRALFCYNGSVISDDNRMVGIQCLRWDIKYPSHKGGKPILQHGDAEATVCMAYFVDDPSAYYTTRRLRQHRTTHVLYRKNNVTAMTNQSASCFPPLGCCSCLISITDVWNSPVMT
jgi:hypothetical protein